MKATPLVSVICIVHNHEPYVEEAINSVLQQTYPNIEIIVVDNGSHDNSGNIIKELEQCHGNIKSILLDENLGICKAFNLGFKRSKGKYVIDLSADDVLMPERIEQGVACLEDRGTSFGVNFTDAFYMDAHGKILTGHYKRDKNGKLRRPVPEGHIYTELLARYVICTPTMMMAASLLEALGGYDEQLSYEDFDFWIRSGKRTKYCYTDKVLVKKRRVPHSLSSGQYRRNSRILDSTYQVCLKAERQIENDEERSALIKRCSYEFRKAILSLNFMAASHFSDLLTRIVRPGLPFFFYSFLHRILRWWKRPTAP